MGISSKQSLHRQEIITIDEAVHPIPITTRHIEGIGNLRRTALEQSTYILTWQHQFIGLKPNLRTTTEPLQYLSSLTSAFAHDARQFFN